MDLPPTRGQAFQRAVRLRCPWCGIGRLFRGRFRMHDACPHCGRVFAPEPGFYLGSIYINYGVTVIVTGLLYAGLVLGLGTPQRVALPTCLAVAVLFPVWFFRYARSLLVALDSSVNRHQRPADDGRDRAAAEAARLTALAADDASAGCLMGVVLALIILFGLAMAAATLFFAGAFSPPRGRPDDGVDLGLRRPTHARSAQACIIVTPNPQASGTATRSQNSTSRTISNADAAVVGPPAGSCSEVGSCLMPTPVAAVAAPCAGTGGEAPGCGPATGRTSRLQTNPRASSPASTDIVWS